MCAAIETKRSRRIKAPKIVYIAGEELTAYCMRLIREQWLAPHVDMSAWEIFDLSCASRDASGDQVVADTIAAGLRVRAIFKEPTVTPTAEQARKMGLRRTLPSPNGAMRRGWNGITISRDTIHISGVQLGYKRPVLFDRHAQGGEYHAGSRMVGPGTLETTFTDRSGARIVVDRRQLNDSLSAVVTYHNPLDNLPHLARVFFDRCLEQRVTPYVVTKKTVFKWQEPFWLAMKRVFDAEYKGRFHSAGLLRASQGELGHLISDAATMHILQWTEGGFGMAAHNYDGDILTDEISQVHRSPAFMTSTLVGADSQGLLIKEFEASHGTASSMWRDHLQGKATSLNPLVLVPLPMIVKKKTVLLAQMLTCPGLTPTAEQHTTQPVFWHTQHA